MQRLRLIGLTTAALLLIHLERASAEDRPLQLRTVSIPSGTTSHPIDRFVDAYSSENSVTTGPIVSDRVFARRVSLDLTGLLPSPERLANLLANSNPRKRKLYIEELLADERAYADHWMTFWNDALRNAYRGTGFIDGGRKQITGWLYESLYRNRPFDQFTRELISPVAGSEGFLHGIKWRGVVNASQRREMQAAQTVAQVFLGTNLKCASCHDSFINDWQLSEAYGMAGIFADGPVEIHHCDKPTGEMAAPAFIFPELGTIDGKAPRVERLKQLATIITAKNNGRFSRTIVNRLWANLFGRGLVEPIDDMSQPAWNEGLLDWLAADFVAHGYDMKHTLRLICTSHAWQREAIGDSRETDSHEDFVFRGPLVRRLTAEQFVDAVSILTDNWQQPTAGMRKRDGRSQGGQLLAVLKAIGETAKPSNGKVDARWIWNDPKAATAAAPATVYFYNELPLKEQPDRVTAIISCDNEFRLVVNEKSNRAAIGKAWNEPAVVDLTSLCRVGTNSIRITARNWGDGNGAKTGSPNPAGLICQIEAWKGKQVIARLSTSEKTGWLTSEKVKADWETAAGKPEGWTKATPVANAVDGPWRIAGRFGQLVSGHTVQSDRVRSVLADPSSLTRALGQPGREQVVTRREDQATMLQVLELTNGQTLETMLKLGAERLLAGAVADEGSGANVVSRRAMIVRRLYQRGLGRLPQEEELQIASLLIGKSPTGDEVARFMWVLIMLPEFQLIR